MYLSVDLVADVAFKCGVESFLFDKFLYAVLAIMHPNASSVRFLRAVKHHFAIGVFHKTYEFRLVGVLLTHDAFSASYANRILFLRDGVIFTEILKGRDTRKVFFDKILNVLTMMGGGVSDVL